MNISWNKYLSLSIIFVVVLLFIPIDDLDAQRRGKKKRRPKKEDQEKVSEPKMENDIFDWKNRLWYGGGFGLGFGGNAVSSQFSVEIQPMVGYKFNKWFSAGPRVSITYVNGKYDLPPVERYNIFNYGVGIFGRIKPINQLFIHGEWGYENVGFLVYDGVELGTERLSRTPLLLGIGYSAGGPGVGGYEILILYDFDVPDTDLQLPIVYRVGFNYNF